MTTKLRRLLRNQYAVPYLRQLWKEKNKKESRVHLRSTEKCISKYSLEGEKDGWLPEDLLDICFSRFDGPLFQELEQVGALNKFTFTQLEGPRPGPEYWFSVTRVADSSKINEALTWAISIDSVVDYGVFSLNLKTYIAYVDTHKHQFRPYGSSYKWFKHLITSEDHHIDYEEMQTYRDEEWVNIHDKKIKRELQTRMQHLKRDLNMKKSNGLSRLIRSTETGYRLLSQP